MNLSRLVPLRSLDNFDAKTFDKELNNIIYTWNSHNSGASGWDNVALGSASFKTGSLIFYNASSIYGTTFQAGNASAAASYTLPTAAPGSNGSLLSGTTAGVLSWKAATARTRQTFTSGSGTYTLPAGVLYVVVRMVGGGGGGSGSGSAGAGNGGNGGNTTFGSSLLAANGGTGGAFTGAAGGAGGTSSLGSGPTGIAFPGGAGGGYSQDALLNATFLAGAKGGSTPFAGGACSGPGNLAGGAGTTNTGEGGQGGGQGAAALDFTGNGGGGGGYVDGLISSPSATYAYAIGAVGTAGTAGTAGYAGGAGGSGFIIVDEFYI